MSFSSSKFRSLVDLPQMPANSPLATRAELKVGCELEDALLAIDGCVARCQQGPARDGQSRGR
jgi:hypothetical protein